MSTDSTSRKGKIVAHMITVTILGISVFVSLVSGTMDSMCEGMKTLAINDGIITPQAVSLDVDEEMVVDGRANLIICTRYEKPIDRQNGMDVFILHHNGDKAEFTKEYDLVVSGPLLRYLTSPDVEYVALGNVSIGEALVAISNEAETHDVIVKIRMKLIVDTSIPIDIYMKDGINTSLDKDVIAGIRGLRERERCFFNIRWTYSYGKRHASVIS